MLSGRQLRQKYLDFFASRGHKVIPSTSLVPQNDPTTLFTSSGMQPLIPYLLGQRHPLGTRLVDSQKSFRSQDIEEVGDNRHTTFFEMLGNWSLGDYFKKEQLAWIWEFFTTEVGLPKDKLHVTLFEGNDQVGRDEESARIWQKLGVPDDHIHYYDAKKNWWSRSGVPDQMPAGEPGGPDSEIFFDFGADLKLHENSQWKNEECHVNCDCGRFLEIGNSVFMQYQKQADGSLKELSQKNVDFGGGLERILAAVHNDPDIFKTDLFLPIINEIENFTEKEYADHATEMRIIADHLKAATFMIAEGLEPSNKLQGYVLRRLLRRSAVKTHLLRGGLTPIPAFEGICHTVISIYPDYFDITADRDKISRVVVNEMVKFGRSLDRGLKELGKYTPDQLNELNAFNLYQTYGFPYEITDELFMAKGKKLDKEKFEHVQKVHQKLSQTASAGMFKGGLADHSETVTKYHTATHLLHQALRDVLGDKVHQAGSNLTSERLRFDFTYDKPLTQEEIKKVENVVNEKISANLSVKVTTMPYEEAIASGALAFFKEKYPDRVNVYSIGDYSKELCGGPHVAVTSEIGKIKVVKQESLGSSLRRIYLTNV